MKAPNLPIFNDNWPDPQEGQARGTDLESLTLAAALALIKAKQEGGDAGGGRVLGDHPDGGSLTVRDGRFGPYVAWGKVFATIPKSQAPDSITLADAIDLVNARAAATGKKGPVKKAAARKAPAKKPAAKAKKIEDSDETPFDDAKPAKKAAARKPVAKTAAVKKIAAAKATAKTAASK